MRRALLTGTGAAMAAVLWCAPALADETIIVRGTDFPTGIRAQLSFVGCENPFQRTAEPLEPTIGIGPGEAPLGSRSLGWDLAGGNAIGSLSYVASMAQTSVASLAIQSDQQAQGVAFAGYVEPADLGTGVTWVGRAALDSAAGPWHTVDATELAYTWVKWDNVAQEVVDRVGEPATVPAFMAAHGGDGPGFYTIGFGCDGAPFHMDALRIGSAGDVTTYDLEGLTTTTSMGGAPRSIVAGQQVTLTGALRDGAGQRLPESTVILEAKQFGDGDFSTVEVVPSDAADPSYDVAPTTHTTYRWRFADRPLAEGSVSAPVTIDVASALTAEQRFDPGDDGTVHVVGTVTPARPGGQVTLWRLTSDGPEKIGLAPVAQDGGYAFDLPADSVLSGRYVTTIPAGAGNLAGLSPVVELRAADVRR